MNLDTENNRALPHDEFAEKAILGAMLINNQYANLVFEKLNSDDFYRESHKKIAAAVSSIIESSAVADIVTVPGHLNKKNQLKFCGGYEYITGLVDGIPDKVDILTYVKSVKDSASLRKIIETSYGVIKKSRESDSSTDSILEGLQNEILKISNDHQTGGFTDSEKIVHDTLEQIEKIQKHGHSGGLETDYTELDKMTGGFQKGNLIVIAARPSMGKTAFALNLVSNMAVKHSKAVGFFSIEMGKDQIMMRLLSLRSEINMSALSTGKPFMNKGEWRKLELAAGELEKSRIFIDDSPSLSIIEMKTRARRLKIEKNLDIVFVDYLQLIKVTGDNSRKIDSRSQEVATISAALKEMAKELEIPVVALAQLNRSPEQRGGGKDGGSPKYQLSDLKESGAIEQDADLIMFLHREEQTNKDTERKGEADIIIAKQRNGPTGNILMAYLSKYTKFTNISHIDRDFI